MSEQEIPVHYDIQKTMDLVKAAKQGDEVSLNVLLTRYSKRIRKVVRLRMGPKLRRRHDSMDLLQEVLLSAFRSFDHYEVQTDARFLHWIAKITENRILALVQHENVKKRDADREVAMEGRGPDGAGVELEAEVPHPLEGLIQSEDQERLEQCLMELPEHYRELILLRNYEEMSWEEVAEETGRPSAAAARVMHAQAMEKLAQRLRKRSGPEGDTPTSALHPDEEG